MNRLEIRTLARKRLGETTSAFWSDSELNNWINFGCSDIAQRTGCLRTNGYISTSSVSQNTAAVIATDWALSTNFTNLLGINDVYFHENGKNWRKMESYTREDLDLEYDGWRDSFGYTDGSSSPATYNTSALPGTPFIYWWDYEEDILQLYPPSDSSNATSNNVRVYYSQDHSSISDDSNSPTIPAPLHLAAVEFVVATGFDSRGQQEKAIDAWDRYRSKLQDYQINLNKLRKDDDTQTKTHRSA